VSFPGYHVGAKDEAVAETHRIVPRTTSYVAYIKAREGTITSAQPHGHRWAIELLGLLRPR
jgi:hypothetical protein